MEYEVICDCMDVSNEDIKKIVEEQKVTNLDEFLEHSEATSGCGGCTDKVEELIEEYCKCAISKS